jgi:hypothetical protein
MSSKKELKESYKQIKPRMGVFQIRNTVNGKILVESSANLGAIWNRYRLQLSMGSHLNAGLQEDWKKYGEDNFSYEILDELVQKEEETRDLGKELKVLEALYLDELQPPAPTTIPSL